MVEAVSFTELPPRPPTPPRSSGSRAISFPEGVHQAPLAAADDLASTPQLSPHPIPSSTASKRVNFSPLTSYIKTPPFPTSGNKTRTPLRTLPPSNLCKPAKSILKSTCFSPVVTSSDDPQSNSQGSFPAMLESVMQQLAGESPTSRSDAYKQLLGALTAYQDMPDTNALKEKVSSISQFIRRDITEISGTYQPQDMKLVRQAINLLTFFVWKQELAASLTDDFKAFIIDHSINILKSSNIPKSCVIDYMRFLSVQSFPPKIMTTTKVSQLLSALKDVTDRVEGKAVVAQRIAIYGQLLVQARQTVASQAALWMDHLVTGLLHNVKEIRLRALKLGLQTCALLGPNASVSSALRDALDVPLENNGSKFVTALCERLMGMVSNGESGPQVPQIWSLIILLLRTKRWSVVQWPHLKDWLLVIQKCFNCSDTGIKIEALMAWDRFVYALSSDESTSKEITNMLLRPILSQLERKKSEKYSALTSQAFSSYRNILYYAFRPSASHERLDACWKEYVSKPILTKLNSQSNNNEQACMILCALLWNPQPRVWDENKGNRSTKMDLEDLPRLDCKWIRSRLSNILPVFESLFKSSVWRNDALPESGIAQAWTNLLKALADAASKEITPSAESMQALASILGLLQRLWKIAPSSLNATGDNLHEAFYDRFHFLARTVISWIGPIPLTDKVLLKTSQETYQTAHTPTHHRPRSENLRSPIVHLVHLICSPPLSELGPAYIRLLHGMIELSMYSRKTRSSQLEMLRQFVQLHLDTSRDSPEPGPLHTIPLKYIWQTVARLAKECLSSSKTNTATKDRDDSVQNDFDKVTKILMAGTRFSGVSAEWTELLQVLNTDIRAERGDSAIIPITETLAEHVSSSQDRSVVFAPALLEVAVFPPTAEESAQAQNVTANKFSLISRQHRHISNDKLTAFVNTTLKTTYEYLGEADAPGVVKFLEAVISFGNRCPPGSRSAFLAKIQEGLSLWLGDQKAQLTTNAGINSIVVSTRSLTVSSMNMLQSSFDNDHALLSKLALLITSGLESRHKSTVNGFIRMWNNTFGGLETVNYPPEVESALRKLRPFVDLRLPGFPSSPEAETDIAVPQFLSSQEEDVPLNQTPRDKQRFPNKILDKNISPSPSRATTPSSTGRERRRKRNNTPLSRSVTTPKARLRHDDSQVQFVAVESSPTADEGLETQVLTENQKEVRDRQRDETAKMFPNIRSSVSRATEESASNSPFPLDRGRQVEDTSLSPMANAGTAMGGSEDEFPGSSPTPGSKNGNTRLRNLHEPLNMSSLEDLSPLPAVDPPSSPPQRRSESPIRPAADGSSDAIRGDTKSGELTVDPYSPTDATIQNETAHGDTIEEAPEKVVMGTTSKSKGQSESGSDAGDDVNKTQLPKDTNSPKVRITSTRGKEQCGTTKQNPAVSRNSRRSPKSGRFSSDASDRVNIIPDSFSDELEQQIASQLEQDMELSMEAERDVSTLQSKQQPCAKSTKRKREEAGSARPVRSKRVSPNSRLTTLPDHGSLRRQPSVEIICPAPSVDGDTGSTAPPGTSRRGRTLRSTHSSPGPRATTVDAQTDEGGNSPLTGSKRSRKRRSLRLSGHTAPDIEPDDSTHQRKRQKSEDPESQFQPVSTQDSGMLDLDNTNVDEHEERSTAKAASPHEPEDLPVERRIDHQPPTPPSPGGILSSLRSVLGSIRNATFGRSVLREIDDVMFDIKVEAHDAARRHEDVDR